MPTRYRIRLWNTLLGLLTFAILGSPRDASALKLWTDRPPRLPTRPTGVAIDRYTFARLTAAVGPAVVAVETFKRGAGGRADIYWRRFFGLRAPRYGGRRGRVRRGLGSGFIIHSSGYIITNNHVVSGAMRIRVKLKDGRAFQARIVGTDPPTDLALLKVHSRRALPVIPLGDSSRLRVGEIVVAIGNPVGLAHTVTQGIVSAKGRRKVRPSGKTGYYNFIQTDAPINRGNSGGPLINLQGQAVGINTAVASRAQGIGFAIPINMAKRILPYLQRHGKFVRAWLGVSAADVPRKLARRLRLKRGQGVLVLAAYPGGPASRAGIRRGDVLVMFDGHRILRRGDLPWYASTAGVGRRVRVVLLRRGVKRRLKVQMGLMPKPGDNVLSKAMGEMWGGGGNTSSLLGVTVGPIDPEMAHQAGLRLARGVQVLAVSRGSPASRVVQPGDIIRKVGATTVRRLEDFVGAALKVQPKQLVRILLWRGRGYRSVEFRHR